MRLLFGFIVFALVVFQLGWIAGEIYDATTVPPITEPVVTEPQFAAIESIKPSTEKASPKDRVSESQIKVYDDRIVLDIAHAQWATFTDTNSMDPVIDAGANAIQLVPTIEEEIQVGDIISYYNKDIKGTVIHRVIKIGHDADGWYAIVQGDNNAAPDPDRVRFDDIQRVLIAIVY